MSLRSLACRLLATCVPALLVLAPPASAQDVESALDALSRAKAAYDAENSAVGASLVELFDARAKELLEDTRSSAEKLAKSTAKSDAEREAFERRGVWPPSFQREELTRRRRAAREALAKGWQDAEQSLVLAQRPEDAADLAADRAAFEISKDLAPWRSAGPFVVDANELRRWIPGGDGWSSPTTDPSKQPPVPFVLHADPPEGAIQYALRFEIQLLAEPCGLDVQFIDSQRRLVQHHVSAAELEIALASKAFGREESAQFVLVVQDDYARLDAEGRPLLRRTSDEKAPDALSAKGSDPWFGLVPERGVKVRIGGVQWKQLGGPDKNADHGTFRPKSRELQAETPRNSADAPGLPMRTDARPRLVRARARPAAVDAAILDGLRWLARHQDEDGSWTPSHLADHCDTDSPSYAPAVPYADEYDASVTALAILAFLDTGIDATAKLEIADKAAGARHEVGDVVRRALGFLVKRQREDGSFARDGDPILVDALATRALCEAFLVLQDPALEAPAQKGLDFLGSVQVRDGAGTARGWMRAAREDTSGAQAASKRNPYDADTAATGWCTAALRTGQLAGLRIDLLSIAGADSFVRRVAETAEGQPTGAVAWVDAGHAGSPSLGSFDAARLHTAAMSAVGILVRRIAGAEGRDPFLVMAADRILRDMPAVSDDRVSVDYFYWHHATLAMSFVGGPDAPKRNTTYWVPWKQRAVDALIALQDRAEGACTHGGWLTPDRWAYEHGGPMCATALSILTLQLCD